jgi:hypothetical protein
MGVTSEMILAYSMANKYRFQTIGQLEVNECQASQEMVSHDK